MIKRRVERRNDRDYLVLFVPSDEYGVIKPEALQPALSILIGGTPRKMKDAEVAQAIRDAATEYDVYLTGEGS